MTDGTVLHGEKVTLRRATENDLPSLAAVLDSPDVARWWGARAHGDALRGELIDADGVTTLAIEVDGEIVGLLQFHEETEPEYRSAGMDIAIAPQGQGRGLGTDALRTMARHLFEDRGHHRLTIDPAVANERAIAVYRKVGFRPVGVMRQYERGPDGVWHDGLLMDLLRDEFT